MQRVSGFLAVWILGVMGCVSQSATPASHQEALGLGIVEGTKGYQQVQKELMPSMQNLSKIRGQVRHLEGGAYVIQTEGQVSVRLPIDENTRIDRPAHKGDWIDAYMNDAGQAVYIHNVDDQVILE